MYVKGNFSSARAAKLGRLGMSTLRTTSWQADSGVGIVEDIYVKD